MSHTGQTNEGDGSPGMIRIVTTGCFFRNGELIFRKPEGSLESYGQEAAEAAHERFIPYLPQGQGKRFEYGDAVSFNMKLFKDWKQLVKPKDEYDYQQRFNELKTLIPQQWRDNMGAAVWNNWQFKYIATEVEKLDAKFVLSPFYNFIADLRKDGVETVLKQFSMLDEYPLQNALKVKFKGNDQRQVQVVRVWNAKKFDHEEALSNIKDENKDWANSQDVAADINGANKEHPRSKPEEIPVRVGRW
ncbi:MAG: hypothetical protein R3301_11225 [Saprospiraceae bacterium]|nr:hypothetical protein [Saprospiraceae bacterium]